MKTNEVVGMQRFTDKESFLKATTTKMRKNYGPVLNIGDVYLFHTAAAEPGLLRAEAGIVKGYSIHD